MISDALFDCRENILEYLREFPDNYGNHFKTRIKPLLRYMQILQQELDIPPSWYLSDYDKWFNKTHKELIDEYGKEIADLYMNDPKYF
jgi:hypothetical protein